MSRDKVSEWSATAASNTDIGGINIAENCPPATINNAIRELMAQCYEWQSGSSADNQIAAGDFKVSGTLNVTGNMNMDGASGTSGQILTSAGSGATPTWTDKVEGAKVGFVQMYSAAAAPTGWLLCDGAAVSRSTYATLFALIGTTYGSGDGGTTFNVPDLRDKFVVGAGTTYANAATGGSKDATLPSHTHALTDPGHNHSYSSPLVPAGVSGTAGVGGGTAQNFPTDNGDSTTTATTGITISSAGSSATDANLPPYIALTFIIKT